MSIDYDIASLRADFPNMPEEVINEWLKPYSKMLGWPPSTRNDELTSGRWRGILAKRTVAFWARVRWRVEEAPLEFTDLTFKAQQTVCGLQDAHYGGIQNDYSQITDGRERLLSILKHVFQFGRIPSSIVLLECDSGLSVIDGHHRLVAYFLNREPQFRGLLPNSAHTFDPKLRQWIGNYPPEVECAL